MVKFYFRASTLGFYRSDIHGSNVPSDVNEITEDQYRTYKTHAKPPEGCVLGADKDGDPVWVEVAHLADDVLVVSACRDIDALCDNVYTRYASRATRYEQKHREALDHQAGVDRVYHYLTAEASARGVTVDEMAVLVIAAADKFNEFGAAAEAARAGLPGLVAAAATYEDKLQAVNTLIQQLEISAEAL